MTSSDSIQWGPIRPVGPEICRSRSIREVLPLWLGRALFTGQVKKVAGDRGSTHPLLKWYWWNDPSPDGTTRDDGGSTWFTWFLIYGRYLQFRILKFPLINGFIPSFCIFFGMRKGIPVLTNPHEVTWDGQLVSSQGLASCPQLNSASQEDVSPCFRINSG